MHEQTSTLPHANPTPRHLLLRLLIERRNWQFGGRRKFWNFYIVFFGILIPARLWILAEGDQMSPFTLGLLLAIGIIVLWRWIASRRIHDRDEYKSTAKRWHKITRLDAGAPEGAVIHDYISALAARNPWTGPAVVYIVTCWLFAQTMVYGVVLLAADNAELATMLSIIGSSIFTIYATIWFLWLRGRKIWTTLYAGITWKRGLATAGIGIVLLIAATLALAPWAPQTQESTVPLNETPLPLTIIAAVIAAPLVEEIVFRGFLLRWLSVRLRGWFGGRWGGVILPVIISSTAFGSLHTVSAWYVASTLLTGVVLALVTVWCRGSILVATLLHASNNGLAVLASTLS